MPVIPELKRHGQFNSRLQNNPVSDKQKEQTVDCGIFFWVLRELYVGLSSSNQAEYPEGPGRIPRGCLCDWAVY